MRNDLPEDLRFLWGCFAEYYAGNGLEPPHRFARREWGFFPFGGKMMFRHIAFRTREEMEDHFRRSAPMHAYHSAAYYQDPGLQPMAKKVEGWMGADLIFDLDADHIPGAESLPYEEQLLRVKVEVGRLIEDFLLDDLGFPRSGTHLYFSGGRGYHVHVRDQSVLGLDSKDRRGIVDYITGRGFSIDTAFPMQTVQVNVRYGSSKTKRTIRPRDWGGWVGKVHKGKDELILKLSRLDRDARTAELMNIASSSGIEAGGSILSSIDDSLFGKSGGKSALRLRESDLFDVFPNSKQLEMFLKLVVGYSSVHLGGETDEPVTTDTKRLIRVPSSLHGKTGLRVTPIPLDRLPDFDPLRDAVALSDDRVPIVVEKDIELGIAGDVLRIASGTSSVPRYAAYFLIARRKARIAPHILTGAE
jgi:DNA primase small subunit